MIQQEPGRELDSWHHPVNKIWEDISRPIILWEIQWEYFQELYAALDEKNRFYTFFPSGFNSAIGNFDNSSWWLPFFVAEFEICFKFSDQVGGPRQKTECLRVKGASLELKVGNLIWHLTYLWHLMTLFLYSWAISYDLNKKGMKTFLDLLELPD